MQALMRLSFAQVESEGLNTGRLRLPQAGGYVTPL